jgi:hypothetical protein
MGVVGRWLKRVVVSIMLILIGFAVYTRYPSSAVSSGLQLDPATEYAVILIHGVGGENEPLLLGIAEQFEAELADQPGAAVVYYDWSPWSDSRLRSGAHGLVLAEQLGAELASLPELRHVRLIVHSAGARFPDPLCEAYQSLAARPAHIEATFIDGMSIRGFMDVGYGYRNFGRCPDFSAAVFSHDGEVPGTNEPLDHAYNIDVTNARGRSESGLDSHHWPLGYFSEQLNPAQMAPGVRSHEQQPRGLVELLGP